MAYIEESLQQGNIYYILHQTYLADMHADCWLGKRQSFVPFSFYTLKADLTDISRKADSHKTTNTSSSYLTFNTYT